MTPQSELTRLRVRVRELEEELEEWRRSDGDVDDAETIAEWRDRLRLTPQAIRVLRILMASPGRFVPRLTLHTQISESAGHPSLVSVYVHRIRACLAEHGHPRAVVSAWGHGYKITPEAAAKIKEMVK